jgi:hypothetical protein
MKQRKWGFVAIAAGLLALEAPCAFPSIATMCPNQIVIKGLTPDSAKVASCSGF